MTTTLDIIRPLISAAYGSCGSTTASRNRGGLYFKTRTTPTDPGTPDQDLARRNFRSVTRAWATTLTQAQRDAWDTYAANFPTLRPLRDPHHPTGRQRFISLNARRKAFGLAIHTDAPTTFAVQTVQPLQVTMTQGSPWAVISWPSQQPVDNPSSHKLLCYNTGPYPSSSDSPKPPFLARWAITLPQSPPIQYPPGFYALAGNRVFFRFVALAPDGRQSAICHARSVVQPP